MRQAGWEKWKVKKWKVHGAPSRMEKVESKKVRLSFRQSDLRSAEKSIIFKEISHCIRNDIHIGHSYIFSNYYPENIQYSLKTETLYKNQITPDTTSGQATN